MYVKKNTMGQRNWILIRAAHGIFYEKTNGIVEKKLEKYSMIKISRKITGREKNEKESQ